jgi:hypothetical protein
MIDYLRWKWKMEEGRALSTGVTQEDLFPFLEGKQEQSRDDCLEAGCSATILYYPP